MMLKIQGTYEAPEGKLVVGDYSVPFNFCAYTGVLAAPYLWLAGTKTSLLELKIHKGLKAILGVKLILYNKSIAQKIPESYHLAPIVKGVPIVGVENFLKVLNDEHSRYDEKCDFELVQGENEFVVMLNNNAKPERCFRNDRVGFYEGNGLLCAIGFFDLKSHEMEKLYGVL